MCVVCGGKLNNLMLLHRQNSTASSILRLAFPSRSKITGLSAVGLACATKCVSHWIEHIRVCPAWQRCSSNSSRRLVLYKQLRHVFFLGKIIVSECRYPWRSLYRWWWQFILVHHSYSFSPFLCQYSTWFVNNSESWFIYVVYLVGHNSSTLSTLWCRSKKWFTCGLLKATTWLKLVGSCSRTASFLCRDIKSDSHLHPVVCLLLLIQFLFFS